MPIAGAMSVVTFTVVLAEMFAAVGLSTLVPAAFIEFARAARRLADTGTLNGLTPEELKKALSGISQFLPIPADAAGGTDLAAKMIQTMLSSSDTLDLLLPKTANIKAEFTFQASESYSAFAGGGGAIDCVSVQAGFGALYSETSSNKINLSIDYVSVQEQLAGARFVGTIPTKALPETVGPQTVKKGETTTVTFAKSIKGSPTSSNTAKVTATSADSTVTLKGVDITDPVDASHPLPTVAITFNDSTSITFPVTVTA